MTEPVELKIQMSDVNQKAIQAFLARRFYGPWPKRLVGLIAVVTMFASYILVSLIIGHEAFPSYGPTWLIPVAASFLTITAFNAFFRRKLEKAVNTSPFQRRPAFPARLDANGIALRGDLIEWSLVVDLDVWSDITLILVSPLQYVPIPHANLPSNLTPADLHARISGWRSAAQAPA
jgi:hypothetical protein